MVFVISFAYFSILVTSFSIGTKKVVHVLDLSPKQLICPSNCSACSFIIKWLSQLDLLWKTIEKS